MVMSRTLLALAALATSSMAAYELQDNYNSTNFFDKFEFFTAPDPTNGFVNYVDQGTAQAGGLISTNGQGQVTLGVDSSSIAPNGRNSVRLTSNSVYNHGLIILDLAHMPQGCGTWPAFWMVGPNWPAEGEIDIIEGVNDQLTNAMTLHTGSGCGITQNNAFSGQISTYNCDVAAPNQVGNAGCSIDAQNQNTYGAGLNAAGGGVYATEWTSEAISIFYFPANSIPKDISSGNPDPLGWGKPLAQFQGGCDLDSYFKNQQLVFDMTFCGDWAGGAWGSSSCASQSWSCNDFVANNPSAFADAYWEINSLKVYQDNGLGFAPPPASTSAGPTGVATGLPAGVSSLAPIPETTSTTQQQTTFATSTSAGGNNILTAATGLFPGNALAPASATSSAAPVASSTSQYVPPPASTSQYVPPPPATTTQAPAPAVTPAPTEEPQPYFSSNEPVPASWFAPGGGIPVGEEFGTLGRKNKGKRVPTTGEAEVEVEQKTEEATPVVKRHAHLRHEMRHQRMAKRGHRHAFV